MAEPNNIYEPSTTDIRRYVEGEMSKSEVYEFEKKMIEDPLLMDAVEGFEKIPDWEGAKELEFRFGASSSSTLYIFIALSSFVLVAAAFFLLKDSSNSQETLVETKPSPNKMEVNEKSSPNESIAATQIIEVNNTDSSVAITLSAAEDTPIEEEHFLTYRESTTPEPMEVIEPEIQKLERDNSLKEARERSNKIYHIKEYKVADYREFRTASLLLNPNALSGTPASENIHESIRPNEPQVRPISYVDFLDETITLFETSEYESNLKNCRIILEHYPDDVNAQFYGGMSAFRLNRCQEASNMLSSAANNSINTFQEEALYYFALSKFEIGEANECVRIMKNIAKTQSFYKTHASKWLKEKELIEQSE